jgi:transcriptional regulator with XRE-family HTH domain
MPKTPRLREWRERATLSQEELKARSGISRATIADLEAGNRGAQPRTIRSLAAALGVEPADLYGDPDSPKVEAPLSQQLTLNGLLAEERRYHPTAQDAQALDRYLYRLQRELDEDRMRRRDVERELDVVRAFGPAVCASMSGETADLILSLGRRLLEKAKELKVRDVAEAEAGVIRLEGWREREAS